MTRSPQVFHRPTVRGSRCYYPEITEENSQGPPGAPSFPQVFHRALTAPVRPVGSRVVTGRISRIASSPPHGRTRKGRHFEATRVPIETKGTRCVPGCGGACGPIETNVPSVPRICDPGLIYAKDDQPDPRSPCPREGTGGGVRPELDSMTGGDAPPLPKDGFEVAPAGSGSPSPNW